MTAFDLNLYVFIGAIILFGIFAIWAARRIESPITYFHDENLRKNVYSLTAANVTLGTGLAYLLQAGHQNGLLMLAIPIMIWLGYYLLGLFLDRVVDPKIFKGKNFFAGINSQIENKLGVASPFGSVVTLSLVFVFTLVFAFEIFASSKILASLLFSSKGTIAAVFLSGIIFIVALLYTLFGGIIAVFGTDKVQLAGIIVFLPMLFYTAVILPVKGGEHVSFDYMLKLDTHIVLAAITASIAAITTQFYNVLNWAAASHVNTSNHKSLMNRVGLYTAIILSVVVIVSVACPIRGKGDGFATLMGTYSILGTQSGTMVLLLSGISVFGMASIVFSTADSLIISIMMFFYDNFLKRNSKNEQRDLNEVRYIRLMLLAFFGVSFLFLAYLNFRQPNLFYLLLTIAGGVIVFSPLFAAVGYLSSRGDSLKVFTAPVIFTYLGLFVVAFVFNILALHTRPTLVTWSGTVAFGISAILSIWFIIRAKQLHLAGSS